MRFTLVTRASPAEVLDALTDFTDRRLEIWPRTLDPDRYEVRERGPTWAVAREATAGSPFWVVSRYDWSDPGAVRWEVVDSSYEGGGDGEVRITAHPSGSLVEARWSNGDPSRQRLLLGLMKRGPSGFLMTRMVRRLWTSALDRHAGSTPRAPR